MRVDLANKHSDSTRPASPVREIEQSGGERIERRTHMHNRTNLEQINCCGVVVVADAIVNL